jgi:hypothetical protein
LIGRARICVGALRRDENVTVGALLVEIARGHERAYRMPSVGGPHDVSNQEVTSCRVLEGSTREQGRSGLGLAAQRFEIEALECAKGSQVSPGTKMFRPEPERMRWCCVRGLLRL